MNIEYLISLGFTKEEAEGISRSQNYTPPSDPQEAVNHAHQWSNYDKEMGSLDNDLSTGRINQEEYVSKQIELSRKARQGKL
jgi:hypothetical protein